VKYYTLDGFAEVMYRYDGKIVCFYDSERKMWHKSIYSWEKVNKWVLMELDESDVFMRLL